MKLITDLEVAQMFTKTYPDKGSFSFTAPCGTGFWDGKNINLRRNSNPVGPAAIDLAPNLVTPVFTPSPPRAMPDIEAIAQDFNIALAPLFEHLVTSSEEVFTARLTTCRSCEFWQEGPSNPKGACYSPNCTYADKLIWRAFEKCPENKWTA